MVLAVWSFLRRFQGAEVGWLELPQDTALTCREPCQRLVRCLRAGVSWSCDARVAVLG